MRRRVTAALACVVIALTLVPAAYAWTCPLGGAVLRPFVFGDDPYAGGLHRGVDLGAEVGAAVRAPASGTVTFVGTVPGGAGAVTIATADGYSVTLLQLGSTLVSRGSIVQEGDVLGSVGPSQDAVTAAPHVHVGLRVSAQEEGYVDPLGVLPACGEAVVASPPVEALPIPLPVEPSPDSEPAPAEVADEPAPVESAPAGPSAVDVPVAEPAATPSTQLDLSDGQSPEAASPVEAAPGSEAADSPVAEAAVSEPRSAGSDTLVAEDAPVPDAVDSPVAEAAASEPQSAGAGTSVADNAPVSELPAAETLDGIQESPLLEEAGEQEQASGSPVAEVAEMPVAEVAEIPAASQPVVQEQVAASEAQVEAPIGETSVRGRAPQTATRVPLPAAVVSPVGIPQVAEHAQPRVSVGAEATATVKGERIRVRRAPQLQSTPRLDESVAVPGGRSKPVHSRSASRDITAPARATPADEGAEPEVAPVRGERRVEVISTKRTDVPAPELPLALVAALACLVALVVSGTAVWLRLRFPRRTQRARIMASGDADERGAEHGSRCGGVAVREWAPAHRPRGRLRRPIRHLRALSPPERRPRTDGEWHGRARDAGHGRRRQRGGVSA
jgi:hypothetical protein